VPPRVLITGITGFAGSHLAERLVADGAAVHGFAFEAPPYPNLAAVAREVQVHRGDITSADEVRASLRASDPDVVIHLAGLAVPTQAARDPAAAVRVNVLGTAALVSALDGMDARLVVASSAEVYGAPASALVDEDAVALPANPYAATKFAAEALAAERGRSGDWTVVILRPTNQIGPRQHPELAASAFAKQIAEAEAGRGDAVVRHGSLDARRDFLDVRDMAGAYARAGEITELGTHVFNIGTGRAVAIGGILKTLSALARVTIRTEVDPERVRAGTATSFALDASRFRAFTGWEPKIPLETSLRDLLDYWRARVREGARV
jgi:GDP-4-dehydro-6-deoxy-D-mannose reductase